MRIAVEKIWKDHSYFLPCSNILKIRLSKAHHRCKRLNMKLAAERKKSTILTKQLESIHYSENALNPVAKQLLNHMQGKLPSNKVPPEIRVFATTLQFYNTKAYNYVRKTFDNILPHVNTITKWYSKIDGSPVFSTQSFELLKLKVAEAKSSNKQCFVSLMLDEMCLKKQIQYQSTSASFKGFVNTGENKDESKAATEALVFMVVGVNRFYFSSLVCH